MSKISIVNIPNKRFWFWFAKYDLISDHTTNDYIHNDNTTNQMFDPYI